MTLYEVNEAAAIIRESADKDVNLIFGAVIDPSMQDQIRITVVATGYPDAENVLGIPQQDRSAVMPRQVVQPARQSYARETVETVVRSASPVEETANVPSFLAPKKKSALDIPPFLKMKSRD